MPISSYKKNKKVICDIRRENFGFKSKSTPPQCKQHMESFKKEFLDMILNIKFRSVKETFQKKLKEEIPKIYEISMKCLNNNIKSFFMTTSQKHIKKRHLN